MDEEGPQFPLMASAMWSMWRQDWFWTWQCFRCSANTARLPRASAEATAPSSKDGSTRTPSAIRTILAPQEGWRSRLQGSSGAVHGTGISVHHDDLRQYFYLFCANIGLILNIFFIIQHYLIKGYPYLICMLSVWG